MKVSETTIPGVLLVEPRVIGDARGYFLETFQASRYQDAGIACDFVQDNLSMSTRGVLRGLHLQEPMAQDKLVYVVHGAVFDVAVDVRVNSPNFGNWVAAELTAENAHQLFIPKGFAHGFYVLSDTVLFAYKCSNPYSAEHEMTIAWDDSDIGIVWPEQNPSLSEKDKGGNKLRDISLADLPHFPG
ncbi:MAG: dTDP-4-dehydrorhamnose 3,5-epimerase [Alphaproteobacteria bacterium]|nr:dTDP-4-dehydrorhamnose 3,5-epimerase [Alphaproteobacteria bacterium]